CMLSVCISFYCSLDLAALHSFPTRRSSDLEDFLGGRGGTLEGDGAHRPLGREPGEAEQAHEVIQVTPRLGVDVVLVIEQVAIGRSEENTSELQSRQNLVCRLLLEKKNDKHV